MKLLSPVLIGIMFCLSACEAPLYVSVPLNYQPTAFLPKDTITIVTINQFDADKLQIGSRQKLSAMKAGAFSAIKAAATRFESLPHVRTINLADSANFKVDTGSIKSIAQKYKADYVLALKNYDFGVLAGDNINFKTSYNIYASVDFQLFENNGVYYKKMNGRYNTRKTEEQYMAITMSGLYNQDARQGGAPVNSSAALAAGDALKEYFPYTIVRTRPVYMDDTLVPALNEIRLKNYAKADSLLQPLLRDSDPAKASRAAYVLAIVYEAQGDIEAAIDMVQQALDKDDLNQGAIDMMCDLREE